MYVKAPAPWMERLGALCVTVWPFIFCHPDMLNTSEESYERVPHRRRQELWRHERVHLEQQRRWWLAAHIFGLMLWFGLYLFCLPVKYNYFRRKWETEAMKAEGDDVTDDIIADRLRHRPYWLA